MFLTVIFSGFRPKPFTGTASPQFGHFIIMLGNPRFTYWGKKKFAPPVNVTTIKHLGLKYGVLLWVDNFAEQSLKALLNSAEYRTNSFRASS
jgi:hypothetical protein